MLLRAMLKRTGDVLAPLSAVAMMLLAGCSAPAADSNARDGNTVLFTPVLEATPPQSVLSLPDTTLRSATSGNPSAPPPPAPPPSPPASTGGGGGGGAGSGGGGAGGGGSQTAPSSQSSSSTTTSASSSPSSSPSSSSSSSSSTSSSPPPSPSSSPSPPSSTSSTPATSSTSSPPPPPSFQWTGVEPSHGSILLHFKLHDAQNIVIHYASAHHSEVLSISNGNGDRNAVLGRLSSNTAYSIHASYSTQSGATFSSVLQVTTAANPYRWAAGSDAWIQPGMAYRITDGSRCTLGFIFQDATNETLYALTAGHCGQIGTTAQFENGTRLGVFSHSWATATGDAGFIRLDSTLRDHVSPVLSHWTGPNSEANSANVRRTDRVCFYGQGQGFGDAAATRHRCGGTATYSDRDGRPGPEVIQFQGSAFSGDSGSPIISYESGAAIGVLTGSLGGYLGGTILCTVSRLLSEAGTPLWLATAQYQPPPADPAPSGVTPPEGTEYECPAR